MSIIPIKNAPVRFLEPDELTLAEQYEDGCTDKFQNFCQIWELQDTTCFQVKLSSVGSELLCQPSFINLFIDGNHGTIESDADGLSSDVSIFFGRASEEAHTGTWSMGHILTGAQGVILRGNTTLTLEVNRTYYLKAWIFLDDNTLTGASVISMDVEGFADSTVTIISQADNGTAFNTWVEIVSKLEVGTITTGNAVVTLTGADEAGSQGLFIDDMAVTCWDLDADFGVFEHDWINDRIILTADDEGTIRQEVNITEGAWYKITPDITTAGAGLRPITFSLGGNSVSYSELAAIPTSFFLQAGGLNNLFELFVRTGTDIDYVNSIFIDQHSIPKFCVIDCNNDTEVCYEYESNVGEGYAYTRGAIDIQFDENGDLWALMCFDWIDFEPGCYKICLYDTATGDSDPVFCTECYCVAENWDCSLMLAWTNNENAFGFNYEDFDLVQYMRVRAKLQKPSYDKEKETFTYSDGRKELLYSNTTKWRDLYIDQLPENLHDAIAIGIEHDIFFIEDTQYISADDDYEPEWEDDALLAKSHIEVSEADTNNLSNFNCD